MSAEDGWEQHPVAGAAADAISAVGTPFSAASVAASVAASAVASAVGTALASPVAATTAATCAATNLAAARSVLVVHGVKLCGVVGRERRVA